MIDPTKGGRPRKDDLRGQLLDSTKVKIPSKFKFLFQPKRYKCAHGGRGSGKSHSFATAMLLYCLEYPLRCLCGREVQRSIKDSVKQLLEDKIQDLGLDSFFTSTTTEIRGANGSKILFAGLGDMSIDQIKSFEGVDIFWGEEAQTLSARSLEVLVPTIRNSRYLPESELWFTWNPKSAKDPVDKRFRGLIKHEDSIVVEVNYNDNPFFPPELEKERLFSREFDGIRYAHIWLGAYEPTAIGAIWNRTILHENRRHEAPDLSRVLVAVDPAVTNLEGSDEHGIIVGGLGVEDNRGYILDDVSMKGTPSQWAARAIAAYDHWEADAIVAESNNGGDMVEHTIKTMRPDIRVVQVKATRGQSKEVRAEPISALYAMGAVSHVGTFHELEDQMCQMTSGGYDGTGSPDRLDACVWLLRELFPRMVKKTMRSLPTHESTKGYDIPR